MRCGFYLAVAIPFASSLTLPARADDKALERMLQDRYEAKLVRVQHTSLPPDVRIEWPPADKQTVDTTVRVYLRVNKLRWKNNQLELRARRVFFYFLDRQMKQVEDNEATYRLQWQKQPLEAQLLEQVGQLLSPVDLHREDWSNFWSPNPPALPPGTPRGPRPNREIAPGVFVPGTDMKYPECIFCPDPDYTDEARKKKVSGYVVFQVRVTETGRVAGMRLVKSLGFGLDEQAVKTISRWRFTPPMRNGKPVAIVMAVETSFALSPNRWGQEP